MLLPYIIALAAATQSPSPQKVLEAGVTLGMAVVRRDTVPPRSGYSTNSPSLQTGPAVTAYAVVWDKAIGLRAAIQLWSSGRESMAGAFGGPVLRFGARNPFILELAAGWVGLPVSQVYYPLPEEDNIWWENPMRSHVSALAFRAGVSHERMLNPRTTLHVAASWFTASAHASIRTARFEPPADTFLHYVSYGLDVGVGWAFK